MSKNCCIFAARKANCRLSKRVSLLWKVPLVVTGVVLGLVLLLLIAVVGVLVTPSAREAVLDKGLVVANEKTDLDIDLGHIYLSPFHHSPMVLYRAWKGEADLPLCVEIDSLFVGHRGQDTLICLHALRLQAVLQSSILNSQSSILNSPIAVSRLYLDRATFHSGELIGAVGIDVIAGLLDVSSPGLVIAEGQFPLHGLRLNDAFIGIDLRPSDDEQPPSDDQASSPMAFDVTDAQMNNIRFLLTPVGLDIQAGSLATSTLADVGGNSYNARRLDIGKAALTIGSFHLPIDTLYGDALVNLNNSLITSNGLHARSDEMGAKVDLSATRLSLESMRVDVAGDADFKGSQALLRGFYDIDDEAYDMHVQVEKVNLEPFLHNGTDIIVAGEIDAAGKGIDIQSPAMRSNVKVRLDDCIYDNIDVSGLDLDAGLADKTVSGTLRLPFAMTDSAMHIKALTEHQFSVADFLKPERMNVDYHAQIHHLRAQIAEEDFRADRLDVDFTTDSTTFLNLATQGLQLDAQSPMHVLKLVDRIQPLLNAVTDSARIQAITSLADLTMLDTIRQLIPDIKTNILLTQGSPAQGIIDRIGINLDAIALALASDAQSTILNSQFSILNSQSPALRLPAATAAVNLTMTEGRTDAALTANTRLTDGVLDVHDLRTDAGLKVGLQREGQQINGTGRLTLDNLAFGDMNLGSRTVDLDVTPSERFPNAIKADVRLDDIPLDLVDSIIHFTDLDLQGAVRAKASADGLPANLDLSAEVLPLDVSAEYKPFEVLLSLGNTPIIMEHNQLDLNNLPIYGADSTFIALTGGLNLDSMRLNVVLQADSFAPIKMVKDGPIPVHGTLATDIYGTVTGPLDSITADVDVTILPSTDITYPIDKKNMAQVKPHGKVNVRFRTADSDLSLRGQVNIDDGVIKYSPKLYPVMPFKIDSGSHITFNGPIGNAFVDVSASQKIKADVESKDEETRRVDFTTGVRVKSLIDSLGIENIGFFLEAPKDETITHELAMLDEDTKDGLAAVLLATGMYMGESNVAAQREGYALSSIINSRLNAAMANSKMGKIIDIDISSGQTEHAVGRTNDMNIAISKSFFKDRLRISVGSTISDNPEVNSSNGLFSSLSAEYRLVPGAPKKQDSINSQSATLNSQSNNAQVFLRLFSQRDYNNVLEGELFKSGLGVRAYKEWKKTSTLNPSILNSQFSILNSQSPDSITRTYSLTADADIAYRSNNSIGPNLALKSSVRNLLGNGEIFSIKGTGAYYWALRDRHPGDPKKTDTYKLGATASLVFPYLHWGNPKDSVRFSQFPDGDTRYMLGYQYENIAGGYGVHKLSGSFSYFIRSPFNQYITHAFTPFSLSVVLMKAEAEDLLDKAAEYPQLIKLLAGDEFVPSIGYTFTYNDYRAKRAVNTMFEIGLKESAMLINAIYCAFGYKWNDLNKPLGNITFNQFLKMSAELRNKFNITDKVAIATRLFAGANLPLGNSDYAPLSEAFYTGGPNSLRASAPYAYGPGDFYSEKYNQSFFHAGDVKLEANFELRFPIVWKLFGAAFLDAGNVWTWNQLLNKESSILHSQFSTLNSQFSFLNTIALGTGAGLRLDIDGLVIRLDLGVGIHAPYQTYKYDKQGNIDKTQPISTYFNIPSALDALRLNFGIGYPF